MTKLIALIIGILGGILIGGGNLEKKVAEALQDELGDKVKGVKVEVHSNPGSFLLRGKIASMDFTFDEFYVEPVVMDEVYFNVKDIRVNLVRSAIAGETRIKSVGEITYRFKVREKDLANGLAKKASSISYPSVEIEGGKIILSGKYRFGFLKVPFEVEGYPSFENKTSLNYRITAVRFVGIKLPTAIDKLLEREINPIFDLDTFYKKKGEEWKVNEEMLGRKLNLTIRHIIARNGVITVTGSI